MAYSDVHCLVCLTINFLINFEKLVLIHLFHVQLIHSIVRLLRYHHFHPFALLLRTKHAVIFPTFLSHKRHITDSYCFFGSVVPNSFCFISLVSLLRPGRGAGYCDQFVCLSLCVCLFASTSLELQHQSSQNLLCSFPVAVARSSSGGVAIRYALTVLWIMSRLVVVGRMAMRG